MSLKTLAAAGALGVGLAISLPATVAADELPVPGDECTVRDAADTRHEGISLEDGSVVQCLQDEDDKRAYYWVVVEESVPDPEPTEEPTKDPDPEPTKAPEPEPTKDPDPEPTPDPTKEPEDPGDGGEGTDGPDDGGGDGDKDGKDDKPEPDETAPVEGDASETLPVTGGALAGLVAAGIAALGGGGTALYLAKKRKATGDTEGINE